MSATVLFLCDYQPISVYTASILIFEYAVCVITTPTPPDFRSLLNLGNNSQGLSCISSKYNLLQNTENMFADYHRSGGSAA
jgi:hypothetical protein